MRTRPGLRWQILVLTALPLLALAGATLWLVDRGVSARSELALADDLHRASRVFENMLAETAGELEATGAVIVRDPRFFSVLALPHHRNDPQFRGTVKGVARDFHHLAQPDVFEVATDMPSWWPRSGASRCCRPRAKPCCRSCSPARQSAGRSRRTARTCCSSARPSWRTGTWWGRCSSAARSRARSPRGSAS